MRKNLSASLRRHAVPLYFIQDRHANACFAYHTSDLVAKMLFCEVHVVIAEVTWPFAGKEDEKQSTCGVSIGGGRHGQEKWGTVIGEVRSTTYTIQYSRCFEAIW